jgi:hypothetical protein
VAPGAHRGPIGISCAVRRDLRPQRIVSGATAAAAIAVAVPCLSLGLSRGNRRWGCPMSGLPSGTVTFLFSDIEGATRLVKALRDRYPQVLAEHRRWPQVDSETSRPDHPGSGGLDYDQAARGRHWHRPAQQSENVHNWTIGHAITKPIQRRGSRKYSAGCGATAARFTRSSHSVTAAHPDRGGWEIPERSQPTPRHPRPPGRRGQGPGIGAGHLRPRRPCSRRSPRGQCP